MVILIGVIIIAICIFCATKCSKYEEKFMTEEQINEKKKEEEKANQRDAARNSDWLLILMFALTPAFLFLIIFLIV